MELKDLVELAVGLLIACTIIGFLLFVSRIGPAVEKRFDSFVSNHFPSATFWISWTLGWLLLVNALFAFARIREFAVTIPGFIAIAHLTLMFRKKYSFAYRIASGEMFLLVALFSSLMFGDPRAGRQPMFDMRIGTFGFWIWCLGITVLVSLAWMCYMAAVKSNSTSNHLIDRPAAR